jgi:hypothetical protein
MDYEMDYEITLGDLEPDSEYESGPDLECPSDLDESELEAESEAESTAPKKKGNNSIEARIQALTKFEDGVLYEKITVQTGVFRSNYYNLKNKTISREWDLLEIFEI